MLVYGLNIYVFIYLFINIYISGQPERRCLRLTIPIPFRLRLQEVGSDSTHPVEEDAHHTSIVVGRTAAAWWPSAAAEGKIPVEGSFSMGGQRHFYLETNTAHAVPTEDGGLVLTCGHQSPSRTQVSLYTIVFHLYRLGGVRVKGLTLNPNNPPHGFGLG